MFSASESFFQPLLGVPVPSARMGIITPLFSFTLGTFGCAHGFVGVATQPASAATVAKACSIVSQLVRSFFGGFSFPTQHTQSYYACALRPTQPVPRA